MVDPIDKFLGEAEFTFDTLNVDSAYDIFNQSYLKSTGKSWEKDKFIERAKNWTFFGDENGYVAVRVQGSGMVKLVGVAGSPRSIYKGILELKTKYSSSPLWGMVSKDIAAQAEKIGFKVLRLKNDISSKIFLKLIKTIIPASVFGGAKINGINPDGTIAFEYSDVGEASKVLVGNEIYFEGLREKILASDKIPDLVKNKVGQLFSDSGLLSEKRRGGEKNPKINYVEMLEKYAEKSDVYVTFTHHIKAGINPKSNYNTPLGVYCFPLKRSIDFYGYKDNRINFPFAHDRPYIFVLKEKSNLKKLLISKYTSAEGERDIRKLMGIYKKNIESIEEILRRARNETEFKQLGIGVFWYFSKLLSESLPGKATVNWNIILRKDLGYDLVVDDRGDGVIHENERVQAFFTDGSKFEIINYIDNPNPSDIPSEDEWKVSKEKRKDRGRIAPINFKVLGNDFKEAANFLKSRLVTDSELSTLLFNSSDKEKMIELIMKVKRNRLTGANINLLMHYSKHKDKLANEIISIKGNYLNGEEIGNVLQYLSADNRRSMAIKILDNIANTINAEGIKNIFYNLEWAPELAIKIAKSKAEKLTSEDVGALVRGQSDELANVLVEILKNKLDYVFIQHVIQAAKHPRDQIIDKIMQYVSKESLNIAVMRYMMDVCSSNKRSDLAMKFLSTIGNNIDAEILGLVMAYAPKHIEDIIHHAMTVAKDNLTAKMMDLILANSKDKMKIMVEILKNKKLDNEEKIVFARNATDVNQIVQMLGGLPANEITSNDIIEARDVKGLLEFVINNATKFDQNILDVVGQASKDGAELIRMLKTIIDRDQEILRNLTHLAHMEGILHYKLDKEARDEMVDYIISKVENKPISRNFASIILNVGHEYANKLIDAVNVNLDAQVTQKILMKLQGRDNQFDCIIKIYNYTKNKADVVETLVSYVENLEKFIEVVGYDFIDLVSPSIVLNKGNTRTKSIIINSFFDRGKIKTGLDLYPLINGSTVEEVLNSILTKHPNLLTDEVVSLLLNEMRFSKYTEEKAKDIVNKIIDAKVDTTEPTWARSIMTNVIPKLRFFVANEISDKVRDGVVSKLRDPADRKMYSDLYLSPLLTTLLMYLHGYDQEKVIKKFSKFIDKNTLMSAVANADVVYFPNSWWDSVYIDSDPTKPQSLQERHLKYKEYFKDLYSM